MDLMAAMRAMTIRSRMWSALIMVVLTIAVIGGVGVAGQLYSNEITSSFMKKEFASMTEIAKLRVAMSMLRQQEKDMLVHYDNTPGIVAARKEWEKTLVDIKQIAAKLSTALPDDASRAKAAKAMAHLEKFREGFVPVAKQLEANAFDTARVALTFVRRISPEYDAAQATVQELADELGVAAVVGERRVESTGELVLSLLAGAALLALAVIGPLTLLNMKSICDPLDEAEHLATYTAQFDLTKRHTNTNGKDELARLLRAVAGMRGALRTMANEVRSSASSIDTASAEIALGNQDLSRRTELTAANLHTASSSMNELTETVRHSAESARQANQLAASAADVAARGGEVVLQVVNTMGEINASSSKISDIIGVIDGIAFQTNILALNAAVEAARAGEQGRGFAVVAGEVRSLAGRSAEAAKEIKALIQTSVDRVEGGSRLVNQAGVTMNEIVSAVQRVSDIIGEITAASAAQSEGITSVNASVALLEEMTQQNAALVEQSAAAAESLNEQTRRLAVVVGRFKLDDTPGTAL